MNFKAATSTDNWQRIDVGSYPHVIIFNDSTINYLAISSTGNSIDGVIFPQEGIEFRDLNEPMLYIKSFNSGQSCNYRIFAFGQTLIQQVQSENLKKTTVPQTIPIAY